MSRSLEFDEIFMRETKNYFGILFGSDKTRRNAEVPQTSDFLNLFLGKYQTRIRLYKEHLQKCIKLYSKDFVINKDH